MTSPRTTRCKGCDATVQVAKTRIHREVFLEPDPDLDGNFLIEADGFVVLVSGAGRARARRRGEALYLEHQCPGRPSR